MSLGGGVNWALAKRENIGRKNIKMALLVLGIVFLVTGCSGRKNKAAITEALNKAFKPEQKVLFLSIGRINESCGASFVEAKPITDQIDFYAAQKAGLISIEPDGPGFWKVDLADRTSREVKTSNRLVHHVKDGCDSSVLGLTLAYKSVADILNVHEIGSETTEVDFTWKWVLAPVGVKLVNSLTEQERSQLTYNLKSADLNLPNDPSFSLVNMTDSTAPHRDKKVLKNTADGWVVNEPSASPSPAEPVASSSAADKDVGMLPKPGEWVRSEAVDRMDGHKTVQFKTLSANQVHLSDREETLLITLGCEERVDLFIHSGTVSTENIRYKFDDSATVETKWDRLDVAGTYLGNALVYRDFLKKMLQAKAFKLEFSPVGQAPQIASFDMGNLKELIQHEKGCDFVKKAWALPF